MFSLLTLLYDRNNEITNQKMLKLFLPLIYNAESLKIVTTPYTPPSPPQKKNIEGSICVTCYVDIKDLPSIVCLTDIY